MLSKPRRPSNCAYEFRATAPQPTDPASTSTTSANRSMLFQAIDVISVPLADRDVISSKNKFASLCQEAEHQLSQHNYDGVFKSYREILELQGISEEDRWNILD